jgi:hypothetical protein
VLKCVLECEGNMSEAAPGKHAGEPSNASAVLTAPHYLSHQRARLAQGPLRELAASNRPSTERRSPGYMAVMVAHILEKHADAPVATEHRQDMYIDMNTILYMQYMHCNCAVPWHSADCATAPHRDPGYSGLNGASMGKSASIVLEYSLTPSSLAITQFCAAAV